MKLNIKKLEEAREQQDKLERKYRERCIGVGYVCQIIPSDGIIGWLLKKPREQLGQIQQSYFLASVWSEQFEIIEFEGSKWVYYDHKVIDSKGHFFRCKKMYEEKFHDFMSVNDREKQLDEFSDEINTFIKTLEEAFEE